METMGIQINIVHSFNVYNPPSNKLDVAVLHQMARTGKVLYVNILYVGKLLNGSKREGLGYFC